MDSRSIFRRPARSSPGGDGGAVRPRADGIARSSEVGERGGGNAAAETREYTGPSGRVTAALAHAPEKIREGRPRPCRPVPQTDTGGRVEHTKALERLTVKELGKPAP